MTELHHRPNPESSEELSLLDIIIVLLKYKRMIFLFVVITVLGGMGLLYLYSKRSPGQSLPQVLLLPSQGVYYAECLIEPESELNKRINLLIYRRNFVFQMIKENHLESDIQKAIHSEEKGEKTSGETSPSPEIYRWVKSNLFTTVSENFLTLGFVAQQRDLPPKMISGILRSISEYFRKPDLERLALQKKGLGQALAETRDPFLKARISEEMAGLLVSESRIRNEKYYRFEILDPPLIVDKVRVVRQGKDKKVEPLEDWVSISSPGYSSRTAKESRYGMVVFLLFLASLVVAVSLAFFLDSIEKTRQRNPEKFTLLKKHLSLRRK